MRYGNPSKKSKTIASLKGHAVEFPGKGSVKKGSEPAGAFLNDDGVLYVFVPPPIRDEVAAAGMLPESEIEEVDAPAGPVKPFDADKLQAEAFDAFRIMVAAAERESFTAAGTPKAQAVEKLLGYSLNNGELKDLWGKFQLEEKAG